MDEIAKQNRIDEITTEYNRIRHHIPLDPNYRLDEGIELIRNALAELPGVFFFEQLLAADLSWKGKNSSDTDEKNKLFEEAITLCEDILARSTEDRWRDCAKQILLVMYADLGMTDKALELAYQMTGPRCTCEYMLTYILKDDDLKNRRKLNAVLYAKLIILDPIQGYLGDGVDMHRANDIRTVMKNIASVAERTGCAVVLVGHLNKTSGQNSAYRGLGSIDFYAAARSVLIVGQLKDQPNVRVIVHEKSSLSPNGESLAFSLGTEAGFHWLDGYEGISSDEILSGVVKGESKTAQAEELIRTMLADGQEVHSEKILKAAEAMGISKRTVHEAKKNLDNIRTRKVGAIWMWSFEEKTPADALSEEESEEAEDILASPPDETKEESPPEVDSLSEDISAETESFAEESAEATTPEAFAALAEDGLSE